MPNTLAASTIQPFAFSNARRIFSVYFGNSLSLAGDVLPAPSSVEEPGLLISLGLVEEDVINMAEGLTYRPSED